MSTQLNPQEIFLLERFISVDYFCELRDTWTEMVKHVERCLDDFSQNLPSNYRSRPLPEQPDIVWGERVLPNFRSTLQKLNQGFIYLTHGDVKGLNYAHGPINDFKGQREFWAGWMSKADETVYGSLLNKAVTMAGNICRTEGAYWNPLALTDYSDDRGPLNPPAEWPSYQVNRNVSTRTGEGLGRSGIYLPDIDDSCAEFLSTEYQQSPSASVFVRFEDLLDPETGKKYGTQRVFEDRHCVWYLVERTSDFDRKVSTSFEGAKVNSTPAGTQCPETGFYMTPARTDSRRHFTKGEIMPDFETGYGMTIWQWDADQA